MLKVLWSVVWFSFSTVHFPNLGISETRFWIWISGKKKKGPGICFCGTFYFQGQNNINCWHVLWEGNAFFLKFLMMCMSVCTCVGGMEVCVCVWGRVQRENWNIKHTYVYMEFSGLTELFLSLQKHNWLVFIFFRIKFSTLCKIYLFLVNSLSLKACRSNSILKTCHRKVIFLSFSSPVFKYLSS